MRIPFCLTVLSFLFFCSCCSILEDRFDCPCYLAVSLPGDYENLHIFVSSEDGFFYEANISDGAAAHTISVPRGPLRLSVWGSVSSCEFDRDGGLTIPEGSDCPEIYFSVVELLADEENVTCQPQLYKHFCSMTILMEAPGSQTVVATVRGDVCGFGPDGLPLSGRFYFSPVGGATTSLDNDFASGAWGYSVRVPRQLTPTLSMEMKTSAGTTTFPLGLYLEEAGYDWTEPDLRDVTLVIDSRDATVTVQTDLWRKSLSFDLVI